MKTELKALIEKLNPVCRRALEESAQACLRHTHYNVEIEHVFWALLGLHESDLHAILRFFDVDSGRAQAEINVALEGFKRGNSRTPAMSPHVPRLLTVAWEISSLQLSSERVRSGALLLAVLTDPTLRGIMRESAPSLMAVSRDRLERSIQDIIVGSPESEKERSPRARSGSRYEAAGASEDSDAAAEDDHGPLASYTIDLVEQALDGKIDAICGRDSEIRQIIDILMRRRQNNPILTGDAGVGKTAVVEGFAIRVAAGDVPPPLKNASVRTLDLGLLQAGAGIKGEFEHRLKGVIKAVKSSPTPIILFIDEAHTIIGAGGAEGQGDAANLLKPALARGELRTIAATTWSEYKKYVEKDPALARRFQVVKIDEPDLPVAEEMLKAGLDKLERHHGVRILDEAVRDAVELSDRHISGRQLPDKAVSVLDTACARVAIGQAGPPAQIENATRRVTAMEVELGALEREQRAGDDHSERIRALERKLKKARATRAALETRWKQEAAIVDRILEVRRLLEAPTVEEPPLNEPPLDEVTDSEADALNDETETPEEAGASDVEEETASRTELLAELGAKRDELQALQKDDPLVPVCVDSRVIASVISDWTGIPVGKMVKNEIRTVLRLKTNMEERIIGQSRALDTICRRIGTASADLADPAKPTGVFLLVGPSGVGKTETALALADCLYGGERTLVTVNMSEYQEAHSISSLKGAPPGYVGYGTGGILTEAVRRRPHCVVLLDEIEKAHSDVLELFYQVFDKGWMEDGEGQVVDFKHTIILLTSNVGAAEIKRACAAAEEMPSSDALMKSVQPALKERFPAAFLGRLVTVPFYPLSTSELRDIVGLKLTTIQRRFWERQQADLTYDDATVEEIVSRCTEEDAGARNIDHIISETMLPELSLKVLEYMAEGDSFNLVHVATGENGDFEYSFGTSDLGQV